MTVALKQQVTVTNKWGVHTRPSTLVAKLAAEFVSDIQISTSSGTADAKSVLQIVMLAASCGTVLEVSASGSDQENALKAICELLQSDFGDVYK